MTVTSENLGGGGSTFPPKDSMLPEFADDFQRVDIGLGIFWGNIWFMADFPFDETSRPGPYASAINPLVQNNQAWWVAGKGNGEAYSVAFPLKLVWMATALEVQSQYSEILLGPMQPPEANTSVSVLTNFPCYAGKALQGHYDMLIENLDGVTAQLTLQRAIYGQNPSATPGMELGDRGISFEDILPPTPDLRAPLTSLFRLESRWTGPVTRWRLQMFANGEPIGPAVFRTDLGRGLPAMAAAQNRGEDTNPNPIAIVRYFRGGRLL